MKTSFIQHKTFDHNLFALYVKNAKQTNHWSNYGETVQTLETRARELLKISEEKAVIATCNGTAALHAMVHGIREFDQLDHRVT